MLQIEIDNDRDADEIVAFLIRRNHLRTTRKSFHYWMNVALSDSKSTSASGLFDRTGCSSSGCMATLVLRPT